MEKKFKIQNKLCKKAYLNAYLELIIGPMFSGKTSKLIEIAKQCKICDIPYIIINHSFDDRFNNIKDSVMSTHDNITITCSYTNKLENIWETLKKTDIDVILINEGQFFLIYMSMLKK